jgi:alpha-beta hydrolase superfamily lysophospholipase
MRAIPLIVVIFLSACAPLRAPQGPARMDPVIGADVFTADDGTLLPLRIWTAEGHPGTVPRAVIVALHGMNDYSNALAMPATVWAKAGITTIAYDQRGFGAGPNPGIWAGGARMRADLRDAIAAAHARWPGVPVFALGESMGGAVLLTALADGAPLPIAGAVLVAPAVWSRADMPVFYRVALFFAAHLTPGLVLSNSAARHVVTIMPSDNIEMLRALGRDPLFQKKTRADMLYGLVNLMDAARAAPAHLTRPGPPILLLYGAHDQVIPAKPTKAVIAALDGSATVHRYETGYHMLLRDLGRALPEKDTADWVLAHAAQPAGNKSSP